MKYVREFLGNLLVAIFLVLALVALVAFSTWPALLPGNWAFVGFGIDGLLILVVVSVLNVLEKEGRL